MSHKRLFVISEIIIFGILFILFLIWFLRPTIKFNDENSIVDYKGVYKEKGAYVIYLGMKRKNAKIKIKGKVDTKKLGEYKITYETNYVGVKIKKEKIIEVKDREKPVIKLNGGEKVVVCPNKKYEEEGYEVTDNYDKDLDKLVKTKEEENKIIYKVKDSSGNASSITREIVYEDNKKPEIALNGGSTYYVYMGNSYKDPGYKVTDNCDSDIKVTKEGSVDDKKLGTYIITYKAVDSKGNEETVKRTVKVVNSNPNKVIYLTFDDGPSSTITPGILKILKEEGVKATFFVINHSSNLDYLIKQEHNEGHTVALHSYTHKYDYIYVSEDNFYSDLNKISDKVYNLIGVRSKIIRFPGGSSNTVSKKYNVGIMTRLSKRLENDDYTYFDWNISSGDASGRLSKTQIYTNVTKTLGSKSNVVLMHDFENNYGTLNALRDIIKYGKENGFTFKAIDENTNPVHHGIAN